MSVLKKLSALVAAARSGALVAWAVNALRAAREKGVAEAFRDLLRGIRLQSGIGVYFDREWSLLLVAEVAQTPVGTVLVREDMIPIMDEEVPTATATKRMDVSVALGIPSKDVMYRVLPARQKATKSKDLLDIIAEAAPGTGLAIDTLTATIRQSEVVATVACRPTCIEAVRPHCAKAGFDIVCCEPAGLAALRASYEHADRPGKTQSQLRVLLGPQEGLGVLLYGTFVLAYEPITKPDNRAVRRTVRLLERFVEANEFCPPVEEIVILGDQGTIAWLDPASISSIPVRTCVAKPYGQLIARGLGMRLLAQDPNDMNLAVTLRQQKSLREALERVISWWEIAAVAAMVVGLWFYQDYQVTALLERAANLGGTTKNRFAAKKPAELKTEVTALNDELTRLDAFLRRRLPVGPLLAGVAGALPAGAVVTSLRCTDLFKGASVEEGQALELKLQLDSRQEPLKARQVDDLTQSLRTNPLIAKYFTHVRLTGPVQWETTQGVLRRASFGLLCTPR